MTQQLTDSPLRISLADVALLARVQRPVVSMWRTRAAGTDNPFPDALTSDRGQPSFDAVEVAEWLATTGRGNNPKPSDDITAFATVTGASARTDRAVFNALTALLCLKVASGRALGGLGKDDLLDLADENDPDDEFLYAEMESIGERLPSVAQHADLLSDADISTPAAFERLMADRFRSGLTEHSSSAISRSALSLAAKIAVTLAARDSMTAVYVDPTPGSSDLLLAVLGEHGDRGGFEVATARSNAPSARLARRRLRVHDVYREDLAMDEGGAFAVGRPVTHVAQFPGPAAPTMTDAQILTAIESIVVQMDDSQNGVLIAPASALSDNFSNPEAVGIRADILRAGHVRAIVRLPKGLSPTRSRQALALWVLGPSHHDDEAAERRTMTADLANSSLTDDVIDSLVSDLTAAAGTRDLVRARAFEFIRPVPTRALLVAKRSLVETALPARPAAAGNDAVLLLQIEQLRERVSEPASRVLTVPGVVVGPGQRETRSVTIDAMLTARRLRMLAGNRLDETHFGSGDGVRVIGVPELIGVGDAGVRKIDRLLLAGSYDAARLTEPGDVVFCAAPRPGAIVDREGGSVVAFPARVLRVDPADPGGLLPDVLAADINSTPAAARHWRLWTVRTVADDQRVALSDALAELGRAREQARRRLTDLGLLSDLTTRAATSGSLTLKPIDAPAKGR